MSNIKLGFLRIESFKKGIVFSSVFSFFSKFLLFLQSVIIAYYFGSGGDTDVYFYCFTTITLLSVFVNSLDSSVLIPESMRLTEQAGKQESIRFLNFFIYLYCFSGLLITGLIYISPIRVFLILSNFNVENIVQNKQILLLSIPLFTLMIMTNLLVNILASYRFFTIPMIIGVTNGVFVLLTIFLFHDGFSLVSVLFGQLASYILNISFLIYLMKKNLKWNFSFQWITLREGILRNIGFAQAGNITSVLVSYIPMYLLSGFSPGIITSLIYGQKTAEMPTQLITNQASSVVGIKLNELTAQENFEALNQVFLMSTRLLLFIMTPVSFIMFLYGQDIISFFFQRGAFSAESVQSSVEFFRYFILLLPMLVINTMVSRMFMAGQKISQSFYYQIAFNICLTVLIFFGIELYGISGYPLALIVLHLLNVFICYWLLAAIFPHIVYNAVIKFFIKIIGLNILVLIGISGLKNVIIEINPILNFFIGGFVYLLIVLTTNWHLNLSHEINDSLKTVLGKFKGKSIRS